MRKFWEKVLKKKLDQLKKPYGFEPSDWSEDFLGSLEFIQNEWKSYLQLHGSGLPIDDLSDAQKALNEDKKWKSLFLFGYSYYNPTLKENFPLTMELIQKWESQITLVMFSTTEPGKNIPAHRGNNHGVLRAQIGIDIKDPEKCSLRVEDKMTFLKEGDFFIFDDTFEHELWNQSNTDRTVLIIDFYKPLPFFYDRLNRKKMNELRKSQYIQSVIHKLTH